MGCRSKPAALARPFAGTCKKMDIAGYLLWVDAQLILETNSGEQLVARLQRTIRFMSRSLLADRAVKIGRRSFFIYRLMEADLEHD